MGPSRDWERWAAWEKQSFAAALHKGRGLGVRGPLRTGLVLPRRSGGFFWVGGPFLLDFLGLVEQVIGLLGEAFAFAGGFDHVGFATIEQVEIGHGIVVVRLQLGGLF